MGRKGHKPEVVELSKARIEGPTAASSHNLVYCLVGLGGAFAWTGVGYVLAWLQGTSRHFLEEWYLLQGFFQVTLGTWLLLQIRSNTLHARVEALCAVGSPSRGIGRRWVRIAIVIGIGVGGTTSLLFLGFPATGSVLVFMWVTCAAVCLTAGIVTLHAIDLIIVVHSLQQTEIKAFRYSPARTKELRDLVDYFTSFALLLTIGYAFTLVGTMNPHWTGSIDYVTAVRGFWPILYVPACLIALIHPHFVVHRLIQREKERTLSHCQQEMDQLLTKYSDLNAAEIDRTNSLAQLFDRISATPDYVVDFKVAVSTVIPIVFNVATLVAKFVPTH